MFRNILLLSGLLALISFYSQAQKTEQSTPVFSVDNKPVTIEEFVYLYRKNHNNSDSEFTREKISEYLDLFINFKLKVAEAQARGIDTTAAFRKEYNTYHDELRKPYLPDSKIIDSLVRLTYERMKEEINASHILITVPPGATAEQDKAALQKITDLKKRADAGEDFGGLAQQFSEDPSAKVNRGDLGYFTALQMVYPFELAAYQTRKGNVSEPVRTRFGYHILKVNDRRPASGEVEVSHIVIRTGDNKDNNEAKNRIFDIYDQLTHGVSWNEVCRQYSEDPATKDNGGKLRPFGIGAMSGVPEFERIAFQLQKPGDISDPFQTQLGWHIIRLERKIPFPLFDEIAGSLKNRVSRDERVQISRQSLLASLKKKYDYLENTSAVSRLLDLADSALTRGAWKKPSFPDAGKTAIFSLRGRDYTVSSFIDYATTHQKRTNLDPASYMKQLIDNFAEASIVSLAEEQIIATSPEYKWLLKEYYEGILLFDIMEKEVWNKAAEDTVGQRKYFAKNSANYKAQERVQAEIYSSANRDHARQIADMLTSSDSVKARELAASLKLKVEEGKFEKDDRIVLSKIQWKKGVQRAENNNLYYVVNVKSLVPPGLKTFDEARAEIISDYQTFLEKEWIQVLRKKHKLVINKKGKEAAFKILSEEKSK